jgi:hypothetical protein
VQVRMEGHELVALGAVESWVVLGGGDVKWCPCRMESWVLLWRLGRRVMMWWPRCCGELGGAVEMREEGHDVVALVLWRAGWCCGGRERGT